jgi:tetratricopeptide (TPR) repeat protein/TolA-binding protein
MNAHYNGFYYAREKAQEVNKIILKSLDDDPNMILRLFPKLDTVLAKSYTKDTEEIVKMASLSIQRHPNSVWVDDNYVQVGLARLYACDWQNAIQTFKYVNTKSKNANVRHQALIYLIRTFIEQADFERAEEVFNFLEKEKLSRKNQKNLYLEKAYFYQLKNDYDKMVRNLSKADSLLTRPDRKGRIYFIVGQVYQKLGFGAEAYNYYKKCLLTNPEYEIDFYARLNMAQVANLNNKKNIRTIRKQFERLLADTKNQEFKDKIYYEMGEFERKQGNVKEAIENYKLAAHAGKIKRIQGSAYLRTGQLYFDSLKKYSLAKAYYDSAIGALPKDYENYSTIKKRQEVLGDFVKYSETIVLQDSLLTMAAMDSTALRSRLDSAFASRKKLEDSRKKKKKKAEQASGGSQQGNNPFFNSDNNNTSDWYFGNSSAVALGQSEFERIWGSVALEDNWRRSTKTSIINATAEKPTAAVEADTKKVNPEKEEPAKETTAQDEAAKVFAQLPTTAKQKEEALSKIDEAYFGLGDLYYFQLQEKENAAATYEKLIARFPESAHAPEVLYKLYLIYKETNNAKAEIFAQQLKEKYPNSTYARILVNPDYLKETSVAAEKQKLMYKEAYSAYLAGNLRVSQEKIIQALKIGETTFSQQLELLEILITGKTEDITKYQLELGAFVKKYPDGTLKPYAEQLLAASQEFQKKLEKAKGIRYVKNADEAHYFAVLHKTADKIADKVSVALESFNQKNQPNQQKLITTSLNFDEMLTVTFVTGFANQAVAQVYLEAFKSSMVSVKPFSEHIFSNFVITKNNFDLFYRTKALDEYLTFFDRNY